MVTSSLSARQHTKKNQLVRAPYRGVPFKQGGVEVERSTLSGPSSTSYRGREEEGRGSGRRDRTQFSRASCDAEVPVPVVASRASTLPSSPSTLNRWFSNLVDSARLRQETRWELWRRRRRRAWRRVRCNVFINITAQQRAPYKQRRGPKLTGRVSEAHSTRVD